MKQHFCSAENSLIQYEKECNWCGEKEWVGLTDEETERLIHNFGADPWTLLDEVEARLKARNT
jgi:hypothetical protein